MTYARGKKAVGLCQRCGFKYAYSTLRRDGDTNLIVCPECYDIEHPAERPIPTKDSTALYRPAPDLDAARSRLILAEGETYPSGTSVPGGAPVGGLPASGDDFLGGLSGFGAPDFAMDYVVEDYVTSDYVQ